MATTDHTVTDEVDAAILRGLIDRRIEVDGPDFDYADPGLVAYARSVRAALDRAHRLLLPSGGKVSTQREWPTAWRHEPGTRQVIAWPDGSRYTGPFVPDPPLTPEETEARRVAVWERVRRVLPNGGLPVVSDNSEVPNG